MIGKESWKDYKTNFSMKFRLTVMYTFFLMVVLILAVLTPFTLVATLPFIVLPFTFSYVSVLCTPELSKNNPILSFFICYPLYYKSFFFGGFRALIGILKAVLISIIFSSILTIILYYTYLRGQPGFAEILQEIQAASNAEEMQTALDHFLSFSPTIFMTKITNLVGGFFGIWAFIHHCLLNSEKFYLNLFNPKPLPMKAVNRLHIAASHLRRKDFFKEYYGAVWYVMIDFVIGFGGGATLSMFVFNFDASQSLYIGLFISLILLFPFIPYYFDVIRNIYLASSDEYSDASIRLSEKALYDLKRNNLLTEEDRKKMEEEIEKSKALIQQMREEEKKELDKQKEAEKDLNKKQ